MPAVLGGHFLLQFYNIMIEGSVTTNMANQYKQNGIWVDMVDMNNIDRIIRINNLQEVTDPIMLVNGNPSPKGVLSYEIFGTSQKERRHRFAYIDLHGHYMNPMAAISLSSYDRTLNDVLLARGRWKLTDDGTLVEDENGDTGPEFLYKIWGKVKVKEKTTLTTKEVESFFKEPRDEIFVTKFLVYPPFTRDLNQGLSGRSKSTEKINSKYNSILSYTQTLNTYTDTFTNMARLTRGRVQQLLIDIYKHLIIDQVKGSPSKFGLINRTMMAKNVRYAARLVITAPILHKGTFEDVQVKFGYATIPLATTLSIFYPFVVHHLKRYFDAYFLEGGKVPVMTKDGKVTLTTYTDSYDENEITKMITRYVNSPSTRFEPFITPPDVNGDRHYIQLTGRFKKDNTTISRPATITDIMYISAVRATENKHVIITRYPLEGWFGQFPARVIVASTIQTTPVIIGETMYQFFPTATGDPNNSFVDTLQFSNTMLDAIGGDFDGDMCTVKPCMTIEANMDAEKAINSISYLLNTSGKLMRTDSKDFVMTAYSLTHAFSSKDVEDGINADINVKKPKYFLS